MRSEQSESDTTNLKYIHHWERHAGTGTLDGLDTQYV